MKIGVLTAMWQRHEVFGIFAAGINRLREKYDIIPVAVGSEGDTSRDLCRKNEFVYIERPNKPLGDKFNEGLSVFKRYPVDYVLIMGSDDLISDSLIEKYIPHMEEGAPVIGVLDIYYYDLLSQELHYWPGYGGRERDRYRIGEPLGLARCLSMDTVDKLNWRPWKGDANRGLDISMWGKLKKEEIKPVTMKLGDSLAVDLKSGNNITDLAAFETTVVDKSIMFNLISAKESKLIELWEKTMRESKKKSI